LKALETRLGLGYPVANDVENSRRSFSEDSQRDIYRSLKKTVLSVGNRREMFLQLTSKLDKFFAIHKGSFSVFDAVKNYMRVPIVFQHGEAKAGLVISIAGDKSIMRSVLQNGTIHVEDFPKQVVGNIVERKLLLLDETNSLAIVPLCHNGEPLGTLNLASPAPFAFSIFSSHLFDYLFTKISQRFAALDT
jgi:hypothetical protein